MAAQDDDLEFLAGCMRCRHRGAMPSFLNPWFQRRATKSDGGGLVRPRNGGEASLQQFEGLAPM